MIYTVNITFLSYSLNISFKQKKPPKKVSSFISDPIRQLAETRDLPDTSGQTV